RHRAAVGEPWRRRGPDVRVRGATGKGWRRVLRLGGLSRCASFSSASAYWQRSGAVRFLDPDGTRWCSRPRSGDPRCAVAVASEVVAEVLLFHHAQGLTPGVKAFADELRSAGHTVHTPDLYDGKTFDTVDDGVAHARELGFGTLLDN